MVPVTLSFTRPATAIEDVVTVDPVAGEVIETVGAVTSRITETTPEPTPPLPSVADAVIRLTPSRRDTPVAVKLVPETVAPIPFTLTVRFGSLTVPVTVIVFVENSAFAVGEVTLTEIFALIATFAAAVAVTVPLLTVTVAV
jgi:hypothetical protein